MSKDENFLQSLGISVKKQVANRLQEKINDEGLEGQVFVLTDDELLEEEKEDYNIVVSKLIDYWLERQEETKYATLRLFPPRGDKAWQMSDTNDDHLKVIFQSDSLPDLLRRGIDFIRNNRQPSEGNTYKWEMKCGKVGYEVDTKAETFNVIQWDKHSKKEQQL